MNVTTKETGTQVSLKLEVSERPIVKPIQVVDWFELFIYITWLMTMWAMIALIVSIWKGWL